MNPVMRLLTTAACVLIAAGGAACTGRAAAPEPTRVDVLRVPDGGVQPDIAVDARGVLHMVYLAGAPAKADVFYTSSSDGRTFAPSVRVNSDPGSAVALGTIRGAQIALGRGGVVHVVWNGSAEARPRPPAGSGMPLLYSRSRDGSAFEPQRSLMTATRDLDGGSSVAATASGGVFVAWHGNALHGEPGERARRVWLARSTDDGATFAAERPISPPEEGACGCCGLRIAAAGSALHVLYRGARDLVHRDVHALESRDDGMTFTARRVDAWEIGACPMSSMAIDAGPTGAVAWEHDGQVAFANAAGGPRVEPAGADTAVERNRRKHPRLARAADGVRLLAWAIGTGWNRGGRVGWQLFDDARPVGAPATLDGLPAWSFPAVAARGQRFVLVY